MRSPDDLVWYQRCRRGLSSGIRSKLLPQLDADGRRFVLTTLSGFAENFAANAVSICLRPSVWLRNKETRLEVQPGFSRLVNWHGHLSALDDWGFRDQLTLVAGSFNMEPDLPVVFPAFAAGH